MFLGLHQGRPVSHLGFKDGSQSVTRQLLRSHHSSKMNTFHGKAESQSSFLCLDHIVPSFLAPEVAHMVIVHQHTSTCIAFNNVNVQNWDLFPDTLWQQGQY